MGVNQSWVEDYSEVVLFGGVLVTGGWLDTVENVQDYYEKPYKYSEEYDSWVAAGRPVDTGPVADWMTAFVGDESDGPSQRRPLKLVQ